MLSVDVEPADTCGRVVARAQAGGRPAGATHAFITATAERHNLTLVTRNVSGFDLLGIRLFNPWSND
jgi:toxin FitB